MVLQEEVYLSIDTASPSLLSIMRRVEKVQNRAAGFVTSN